MCLSLKAAQFGDESRSRRWWRARPIGASLVVGLFGIALLSNSALAQQPSAATINELHQRYKPRLPDLTPAMIRGMWQSQLEDPPWFQPTYSVLQAEKENPRIIQSCTRN